MFLWIWIPICQLQTDIDECANVSLHPLCQTKSICVNLIGSYSCTCIDGYEGDPFTGCTDTDECLLDSTNDCMTNSDCINLEGTYECECQSGFECKLKREMNQKYLLYFSSHFSWFFTMPDKSEYSRILTGIDCFTKLPKRLFQEPIMFMVDYCISRPESSFENPWFRGIVWTPMNKKFKS